MLDRRRRAVLLTTCLVAVLFALPWPGPLERWSGDLDALFLAFTTQHRSRPSSPPQDIVGVVIDSASLEALGRFPWKRGVHARLIDRLTAMGAAVIVLDIYFVRPTEPLEDAALAAAMKRSGRVVVAAGVPDGRTPTSLFAEVARVGQIDAPREDGGMVYRIEPLGRDAAGLPCPSLSLVAVQVLRHTDDLPVLGDDVLRLGTLAVPLEDGRMTVHFSGPPGTLRTLRYVDVLEGRVDPQAVAGRIALVYSGFDPNDQFETPIDRTHRMRGGELHANAMDTMLTARFIRRLGPAGRTALLLGVALLLAAAMASGRASVYLPSLLVLCAGLAGAAWLALDGLLLWLPVGRVVLFVPLGAAAVLAVDRVRAGRMLAAFVPGEEARRLLDADPPQARGSREVEVSVLFADIRGYTTLSETVSPQRMIELLDEFHAVTDAAVRAHGGEVFDYMGDASMVVFGAPREVADHARHAVEAALDMQARLVEKRVEWTSRGYPEVHVGIGICTGPVAYGVVGTSHRQYTAIGDTTNVAARIQGLSGQFGCGVLISDSTLRAAGDGFRTRPLPPVPLKGKTEAVQIHAVEGRKEDDDA